MQLPPHDGRHRPPPPVRTTDETDAVEAMCWDDAEVPDERQRLVLSTGGALHGEPRGPEAPKPALLGALHGAWCGELHRRCGGASFAPPSDPGTELWPASRRTTPFASLQASELTEKPRVCSKQELLIAPQPDATEVSEDDCVERATSDAELSALEGAAGSESLDSFCVQRSASEKFDTRGFDSVVPGCGRVPVGPRHDPAHGGGELSVVPVAPAPAVVGKPQLGGGGDATATEHLSQTRPHQSQHPLLGAPELLPCIKLLDVGVLCSLQSPLPRCQDIDAHLFAAPGPDDIVIAVSHAWRNQAHPDPNGTKTKLLQRLLPGMQSGPSNRTLLFFDFVSISQRPFREGQEDRTEEEDQQFKAALKCMHNMYFYADRLVHLDLVKDQIADEGASYIVHGSDLAGAKFGNAASAIQIIGWEQPSQNTGVEKQWKLFDWIASVDGEAVQSLDHLQAVLCDSSLVELRRFPFGRVNEIAASARGWVYLERFISMVKCSMLEAENAMNIVASDSEVILEQIRTGANVLRTAALKSRVRTGEAGTWFGRHNAIVPRGGLLRSTTLAWASSKVLGAATASGSDLVFPPDSLDDALNGFLEELKRKQFSGASTDALLFTSDAEIVADIMTEFVNHLRRHWHAEASKQQTRAETLASAFRAKAARVRSFAAHELLDWDQFSEVYSERHNKLSTKNPAPLGIVAFLPLASVITVLLWPLERADAGWRKNAAGFFPWHCVMAAAVLGYFPLLFFVLSDVPLNRRALALVFCWLLCSVMVISAGLIVMMALLDVFPLPFSHLISTVIFAPLAPIIWWLVPAEVRSRDNVQMRVAWAFIGVASIVVVFGIVYPLLGAQFTQSTTGWQALIIVLFLLLKIAFERLGHFLARRLGADITCIIVFAGASSYESMLCVVLANVDHWALFLELVCIDIMENAYYVVYLWQHRATIRPRQQRLIVASLIVREFVEVMTPILYVIVQVTSYYVQPVYLDTLCWMTQKEFRGQFLYILVDLIIEIGVLAITCSVLVQLNSRPLQELIGHIRLHLLLYAASSTCATCYLVTLSHSHAGADFTFGFVWLSQGNATWCCGLHWRSGVYSCKSNLL